MNRSTIVVRVPRASSIVALVLAAALLAAAGFSALTHPAEAAGRTRVVVIDAGHQGRVNKGLEPVGPGSSTKKPKVAGGTSGVATHKPESLVNLQVAKRLATQLKKRGIKVIMIRTSENVNIPNSARAKTANAAHADLIIHLHCDSAGRSTKGLLVMVPAKNKWTGPILTRSARAGNAIQKFTLAATGAKNRGISKRGDLVGFNYSSVPSVFVEMGLMSNAAEDRKLSTPAYQDKLAVGMANGIKSYLAGK
jgi:N-acetylmuramoyl-L-alanine amidase